MRTKITDVQDVKQQLTEFVSTNYPEVHNLKIKGDWYIATIRARYKNRYIYAKAYGLKRAVTWFLEDLDRKVCREASPEA
ncbi:MAG: hypothetical protein LBK58_12210 [Prevotellaceae bacterium]|jgi:hypothetical protein|nr:hypothetical protein [Prevotellaceae bacterium]